MHSDHLVLWTSLFKFELCGVKQDLIPYVGQLVLPNVPVEGWVIDPDKHGLLDGPCDVAGLLP